MSSNQQDHEALDSGDDDDWNAKLLRLFRTGECYDCTLKVGRDGESGYKDFKCHTMILSVASLFFRKLFLGDFKEARMGRDEPITLDKFDPEVFECAMENVYGKLTEFRSVSFAVEIFKFAHEMLCDSLANDLIEFIGAKVKPEEVFTTYDFFNQIGSKAGLKKCLEIISKDPATALGSDAWLQISGESVDEFVQEDCVPEADLVTAFVKWVKFQMQEDGVDPEQSEEILRGHVLTTIKEIQISGLSNTDFSQLILGGGEGSA